MAGQAAEAWPVGTKQNRHIAGEIHCANGVGVVVDVRRMKARFTAVLSGGEETPPVTTTATGQAQIVLAPDAQSFRALVATDLTDEETTQARIDIGQPGQNGPVAFFLSASSFGSPLLVTLTPAEFLTSPQAPTYDDFLDELRAGNTYINLPTVAHASGELRGKAADAVVRAPGRAAQAEGRDPRPRRRPPLIRLQGDRRILPRPWDLPARGLRPRPRRRLGR